MTDTDQKREDAVLRQMLKTPHKPHKATGLTPSKAKKAKGDEPKPAPSAFKRPVDYTAD